MNLLILKLMLGYSFLTRNMDFQYIYKIDDDTFPNLDVITKKMLPQLTGHNYVGGATHPKGAPMNNKWHFGKCSSPAFDKPYKFDEAPYEFAKGGYGYFLRRDILPIIEAQEGIIAQELTDGLYSFEDVRISEMLGSRGITAHKLDGYTVSKDGDLNENVLIFDIADVDRFYEYAKQKEI